MAIGSIVLGGRTVAYVSVGDYYDWRALHLDGAAVGGADRIEIVPVSLKHLPAVGSKALFNIIIHRKSRIALDGDAV